MAEGMDSTAVFWRAIHVFRTHVSEQVHTRWRVWAHRHEKRHVHEVVLGLLARQATLASEFASNPPIWNLHAAPLFLRPMVENCITISWILEKQDERAKQFVAYGLGQENLLLEQAKATLRETGADPDKDPEIQQWAQRLNNEQYTFLTEVNVGSWGPNLYNMAKESGHVNLYNQDYTRWSSTTHNMWHHIIRFNLDTCAESLHGYHRIPSIPTRRMTPIPGLLQLAAEYFDIAIRSFDKATETHVGDLSALGVLDRELKRMPDPPSTSA